MKIIASIVALNLAVAFATPVVAAEIPTTKAECEQAGMRWKESGYAVLLMRASFLPQYVLSLALSGLA